MRQIAAIRRGLALPYRCCDNSSSASTARLKMLCSPDPIVAAEPSSVADGSLKIVQDAACTFCGCVCDDIEVAVRNGALVAAERACELGQSWFFSHQHKQRPSCRIAGQPATVAEGIERAAQILAAAKYPLIYGLRDTTCEAQRVAVGIADWIGGTVDSTTSLDHGPSGVSFQGVGEVTCSLGEIANRGDLIIFWGSNPADTHPRHFSRYSLFPTGMFVPGGRQDRTCVVVDVHPTKSAESADIFLQIKPGKDFEALWTLRALAQGQTLDAVEVAEETGVPLSVWQDLIERMKRANFGVILYGMGLTMTRGRHLNSEAVWALVRDMNAYTRFVARAMRTGGNAIGADNVLTWQTGYPFGVNLTRGYPRFNPGEYTAAEMLARNEPDAALIVTGDPMSDFAPPARERLAAIPYVSLDFRESPTSRAATVAFTTAAYGINTAGTVYRMDDVPIPLRPVLESNHPSDFDVLSGIEQGVKQIRGAARAS
jgi:formylmethanofuran dehydrogenase subunit B